MDRGTYTQAGYDDSKWSPDYKSGVLGIGYNSNFRLKKVGEMLNPNDFVYGWKTGLTRADSAAKDRLGQPISKASRLIFAPLTEDAEAAAAATRPRSESSTHRRPPMRKWQCGHKRDGESRCIVCYTLYGHRVAV